MRARMAAAISALVVSAVGGCGGGGSGALEPPRDLVVEQGPSFDELTITWTEPSGDVDGYEIAGRLAGGSWEQWPEVIPAPAVGVYATLEPSVPELVTLGVRVRSARGGTRSDWSPEATMFRSVRPPSAFSASVGDTTVTGWHVPPVHLAWTNESAVATGLQIERAPGSNPGEADFVAVATLGATASGHDDAGATEGSWTYRIRAGAGGVWGPWSSTYLWDAVDIVPPRDLVATLESGGVRLTWTSGSALAEQQVSRFEPSGYGQVVASLPVGADEYLDAVSAPWPAARYQVTAVIPTAGGPRAATAEIPVGPFTLEGPVTLDASARLAPWAMHLALTDGGLLHAATWGPPVLAIERDTAGGWERHALADALSFAMPAVLADGSGHPHTVVYRGYPDQPTTALVHEWFDGAAWREETVTTAPGDGATFALGPGGALHVLATRREPSGSYTTVHHYAAGGTVISTDVLPTVLPTPPSGGGPFHERGHDLAVAADGTAWLAMSYSAPPLADTTFVMFRRTAAGAWAQQLAPAANTIAVASVAAGSIDVAALIYDWTARFRTASGWMPEEAVAVPLAGMELLDAVLAADGVRLHLLLRRHPDGLWLSARGAGGWEAMLLGAPAPAWGRTGFTADGRATVVVPHGPDLQFRAWVSLFVEPP